MKHLLIAAAIAASVASPSLMAASISSASLSHFTFSLEDIDSNDGITSSVSFNPLLNYSLQGALISFPSTLQSFASNSTLTETIADSSSQASATFSRAIVFDNSAFLNTSLQTNGSTQGIMADSSNRATSSISAFQGFTLSANTILTIFVDSLLFNQTTVSGADSSAASSQIFFFNPTGTKNQDDHQLFESTSAQSFSEQKTLSINFFNVTGEEVLGSFGASVNVDVTSNATTSPPSAVPVPAALPLMASALGIFGLARRRNKSKAA